MVQSYIYEFAAQATMNPSRLPMPNAPLRSHNRPASITCRPASTSSLRNLSADTEMISSSPTSLANAEISSEVVDETDHMEENSDDEHSEDKMHFASLAEARHWQLREQSSDQGRMDNTLPAEGEKSAIVVKMISAFGYMGPEALINPDGTKRCPDVTKANIEHALAHPKAVEALCWDLLEETIRRCEGKPLCAVYAPPKFQRKEAAFADRIKGVIKALKVSKNLCKHLFEPPFASRVIDDPWNEIRKVQTNDINNKRKQEVMKRAMQLQQSAEADGSTTGARSASLLAEEDDGEPRPKRSHRRSLKMA